MRGINFEEVAKVSGGMVGAPITDNGIPLWEASTTTGTTRTWDDGSMSIFDSNGVLLGAVGTDGNVTLLTDPYNRGDTNGFGTQVIGMFGTAGNAISAILNGAGQYNSLLGGLGPGGTQTLPSGDFIGP